MGLFDWLTGKNNVDIAEDRIWLTQEAKTAGIRKEAAQAVADPAGPSAVIVVAHFDDCLEQLQAAVNGLDRDWLLVILADVLARGTPSHWAAHESRGILILVGEWHPLPSHNEALADFACRLPCRCRIARHVSLEDPLSKRFFSGEWVERVLRGLGMKEDEAIRSRMVSRRIRAALKKIARDAMGDAPANSAEEWLRRNTPRF